MFMHPTGILCALERELAPFLAQMQKVTTKKAANLTLHTGQLNGCPVFAAACGIGKVNAAMAALTLIRDFGAAALINAGTAGGMAPQVKILDTVVCAASAYHDLDPAFLTGRHIPHTADARFAADSRLLAAAKKTAAGKPRAVHFGLTVTGDSFIDIDGRAAINEAFNPLCVDMESAACAHVCYVCNTPFIAVRAVSDSEEEHGEGVFEQHCAEASRLACEFVLDMLKAL